MTKQQREAIDQLVNQQITQGLSGLGDPVGQFDAFESSQLPGVIIARIEQYEEADDGGTIPIYHYHAVDADGTISHDADLKIEQLKDKGLFYNSLTPISL